MTAQDLKNSILQLAVQGNLVPQDPNDEPASELLNRIRLDNKNNTFISINEDEIPFDIPNSWEWIRLGDLSNINGGFAFKSTNYTHNGARVIRISDFNESGFVNASIVRHPYDESLQSYVLESKNILLCMTGGTVGKSLFVHNVGELMIVNQRVATIKVKIALPEYVYQVILSPFIQQIINISKNSTNDNISMETIKNFLIPLPPLAEQKRIVAKIEELLPLVENYGDAEERLKALNAEFPDKLRKSILQQAVQGKLTEHDPADEPASELLKRIRTERAVLQKNKTAKKSQANETIAVDEIPFDIPDTWEWVNLGWICQKVGAGSTPKGGSAVYVPEGIKFFREQNIHDDGLRLDGVAYIDEQTHAAKAGSQVQAQDILMNITGASIGRNALVPDDFDTANVNQHVLIIRLVDKELRHYLHYCFSSPAVLNQMFTKQVGDKPGLSATKVENFLVPIPPLAEQKRIVTRIEELLAVCDGLK